MDGLEGVETTLGSLEQVNNNLKEWEAKIAQLREVKDGAGRGIDEGILETVTAFNLLGINTSGSCEGHTDHSYTPWIDVEPASKDQELAQKVDKAYEAAYKVDQNLQKAEWERLITEAHQLREKLDVKSQSEFLKLAPYLNEFYEERNTPYMQRLISVFRGPGVRITNQGEVAQAGLSEQERTKNLQSYQVEMKDFTDFLKSKFLNSPKTV